MKYLLLLLISISFIACSDEVADLTVDEYIDAKKLVAIELDKGVFIVIDRPGNDKKPNINSKITVNYDGMLTNGSTFDSGSNAVFQLSGVIEGWRIGMKELGEGGSGTIIIPPAVAYGSSSAGGIPPNSVLVFDVDLIKVE